MSSTRARLRDILPDTDLTEARRVLRLEADALIALSDALDGRFVELLDLCVGLSGRLIVTGMGKSGHVARKIAATCASTGQSAFFVHPAEASHGDLGMITRDDAVLALSNSGETPELKDVIAYTRRFRIPLIGMTRIADSFLAGQSDIPLILPKSPEACPNRQAPTTSTTVMMALGDALAVALMARRNFNADDFRVFHPGGKLGQHLFKVADIMRVEQAVPLVTPDTPMADVITVMNDKKLGCSGVVDSRGALVGIITDGDIRRHVADGFCALTADRVMTAQPATIEPDELAVTALDFMNGGNAKGRDITSLFVTRNDKPVGIIHMHDCLRMGVA